MEEKAFLSRDIYNSIGNIHAPLWFKLFFSIEHFIFLHHIELNLNVPYNGR